MFFYVLRADAVQGRCLVRLYGGPPSSSSSSHLISGKSLERYGSGEYHFETLVIPVKPL